MDDFRVDGYYVSRGMVKFIAHRIGSCGNQWLYEPYTTIRDLMLAGF